MLAASPEALWSTYDVAMLDLDGVVYIGPDAVPGVPDRLAEAAKAGLHLAYVTNNASRTPHAVADHLRRLGIPVDDGDVVTAAQAAARLLGDRLDEGSPVFVIGGEGLEVALAEQGLKPVQDRDAAPLAVASGYSGDLRWSTVVAGALLVRDGLPWVASNTDMTVPTPQGAGPGNGVLVDVVARFTGRKPVVAGKPEPPLFEETMRRVGGSRPLVVGDRLDTDIEGANRTGYDSLLVMTGVTGLTELVAARPDQRPTYVAGDLGGLGRAQREPNYDDGTVTCQGWRATVEDGALRIEGTGDLADAGSSGLDAWWQAAATASWVHLDATGTPVDVTGVLPPGSVDDAPPGE
ncbi:MAG: HAD-IIA family hydrolase [Nocardioidaceae bacterium]